MRNPDDSTFFGIPFVLQRQDATELVQTLTRLWERQMKESLGPLESDLDRLRLYFDPLARGNRIRKLISEFEDEAIPLPRLVREPLIVGTSEVAIVTMEGRIVLEVCKQVLEDAAGSLIVLDPELLQAAEHATNARYRKWSIKRIEDVIKLLSVESGFMHLSSIAWVLFLIINGSTSSKAGIASQENAEERELLEASVRRIIGTFVETLSPGQRDDRTYSIYQGYALTEARRRLSGIISADSPYILEGQEGKAVERILLELNRPQRSLKPENILAAFDRMIDSYRIERSRLALFGVAHENRTKTRQLRQSLEEGLGYHR